MNKIKLLIKEEILTMSNGIIIESNSSVAPGFKKAMQKGFPDSLSAAKISGIVKQMPYDQVTKAIDALAKILPRNNVVSEVKKPSIRQVLSVVGAFSQLKTIIKYILPKVGGGAIAGYSTPMSIVLILLYFLIKRLRKGSDIDRESTRKLVIAGLM